MKQLRDRVAVVTGGASGIGLGMATAFAAEGMKLVLADIEQEPLDKAVSDLAANGASAIGVPTDVSKPAALDELRDRTLTEYGAAHVLCNNAGVGGAAGAPLWALPDEEWDWVMGVNLMGVVHGIRSFVPILLEQDEGHVVNTASMAGLMPGGGIYGVTKHACRAISEALWSNLQMRGPHVGVSVLCPGWVATNIASSERNRPEMPGPRPEIPPEAEAMRHAVEGLIDSGMDPAEVGRIVAAAIKEKRFYVLPHRWESMVETFLGNIIEGRDPVGEPPPGAAEALAALLPQTGERS